MAEKKNPKTGKNVFQRTATKNMTRVKGRSMAGQRSLDYMKPAKFADYLTRSELALFVPCDPSWILKLEKQERIPQAQRVMMGNVSVRLWSPKQAEEIKRIIEGHKVGRPKNS